MPGGSACLLFNFQNPFLNRFQEQTFEQTEALELYLAAELSHTERLSTELSRQEENNTRLHFRLETCEAERDVLAAEVCKIEQLATEVSRKEELNEQFERRLGACDADREVTP